MGTSEDTALASAAADALFTPVQQRVLGILFGQPERRFQSAEVIRLADSGTGATHRLLQRLEAAGVVSMVRQGRQKYYQANRSSPVFEELSGIVRKTVGLVTPLREALAALGPAITAAFVYGSVAGGRERSDSDIDLMVIAKEDLDYPTLFEAIQAAERRLGRRVHPNLMSLAEWRELGKVDDGFVDRISKAARVFVIGGEGDLD